MSFICTLLNAKRLEISQCMKFHSMPVKELLQKADQKYLHLQMAIFLFHRRTNTHSNNDSVRYGDKSAAEPLTELTSPAFSSVFYLSKDFLISVEAALWKYL